MSVTNEIMVQRIKAACRKKDMTVSSLEKRLGWSPGLISRWKQNNSPSIDKIIDIARELDVSISYLVGETDVADNRGKNNFETAVVNATLSKKIIWDKLPEEQNIFDEETISKICGSDKYEERILYHFYDDETGHYILAVQWNELNVNRDMNVYLKLSSIVCPHSDPMPKLENKDTLLQMIEIIDSKTHHDISVADDKLSDIKFIEKYGDN